MQSKSLLLCMITLVGASIFAAFTPAPIESDQNSTMPEVEGPITDWISVGTWDAATFTDNSADTIQAPLATASIQLFIGGPCPGLKQVSVVGASPSGTIQFVYGPAGTYTVASGPCVGMVLAMSPPTLGPTVTADAAGIFSAVYFIPAALCGMVVQAVDVATCTASPPSTL